MPDGSSRFAPAAVDSIFMRTRAADPTAWWKSFPRTLAAAIGVVLLLGPALADESILPLDRLVGRRVGDFRLVDVQTRQEVWLYGLAARNTGLATALGATPARGVVLVFVSPGCPLGEKYLPRLAEMADHYRERGVWFFGIASGAGDTLEELRAWAEERKPGFPILHDVGNVQADALLVERSNEAILLDARARIRYRGGIDDQYGYGFTRPEPRHRYLADAVDAILARPSRAVSVKATDVAGCRLTRVQPTGPTLPPVQRVRPAAAAITAHLEAAEPPPEVGPVDFAVYVAPILQDRCQACHRPGQVGGFSLLTAADARSHAAMIAEVVADRRMPPWHADPRHGEFANDRRLTSRERAVLLAWVDQGSPVGDVSREPPPRQWPEGWTIGVPDVVFEIPENNTVPAQGTVPYVTMRVPTGFTEDVWVQAAEARPGNSAVVHHILVFVEPPDGGRRRIAGDADGQLCGYAPGDMPSVFPAGTAKKIPAGSRLRFQLHYTPNGRVQTDRSKVGLIFATTPPVREAVTLGIANPRFLIPAGADSHPVQAEHRFDREVRLLSFMPHMHLRGKAFRYTLHTPGLATEVLLDVPAYDFGWQTYYTLARPRTLPAGSRIVCDAVFDNSADNPANPDPTRSVTWGEQTWEEMMIGYVDVDLPHD